MVYERKKDKMRPFLYILIFPLILSCEKRVPLWTVQEYIIEQGKTEKGYVSESVGLRPSESLAQLKCFSQAKIKLQNTIRGKIEEDFKEFFNYSKEIEPYREKVKIFREMMKEISTEIIQKLSDQLEQEGIYIDRENSVLFCRLSIKFDENFYNVLREVSLDLIKTNYYKQIYNEEAPKKIEDYVEMNLKRIRAGRNQ